jgi:serine/threonine protein kinase
VCGSAHGAVTATADGPLQGGPGKKYGPEVDLWGCGVILFVLLSGNPPFYHEKDRALYELIRNGAYSFQDPVWDLISDECVPLTPTAAGRCRRAHPVSAQAQPDSDTACMRSVWRWCHRGLRCRAKDLIQKLLVVDPAQRLTAQQALAHPWIAQYDNVSAPAGDLTGALDNLRNMYRRV